MQAMNRFGNTAARPAQRAAIAVLVAVGLGGCAWQEPARVEADFGQSVRQMVQEQIYDRQAAAEPAQNGPDLLDGPTADIGVEGYRQSAREARTSRGQQPDNPVPVSGQAGSSEAE